MAKGLRRGIKQSTNTNDAISFFSFPGKNGNMTSVGFDPTIFILLVIHYTVVAYDPPVVRYLHDRVLWICVGQWVML